MKHDKRKRKFWMGNGVLALAMVMLLFMGPLSSLLGIWAVAIWMGLAGAGVALLMSGQADEPPMPD